MKRFVLIAFEFDDNGSGEDLAIVSSDFFKSLVADEIRYNSVSITPIQKKHCSLDTLGQIFPGLR